MSNINDVAVETDETILQREFDFANSRPGRFATFEMYVNIGDDVLGVTCGHRRTAKLLAAVEASRRMYPSTNGCSEPYMHGYILAGEIFRRFIKSVSVGNAVHEGGASALNHLAETAVLAIAREWILRTGGFGSLPGIDPATADRLTREFEDEFNDRQLLDALTTDGGDAD